MRGWWGWLVVLGCSNDGQNKPIGRGDSGAIDLDPSVPPDSAPTGPTGGTEETGAATATETGDTGVGLTDTGPPPAPPCAPLTGLQVGPVEVREGRLSNQFEVSFSTTSPSTGAVRCQARSEPGELHLVEGELTTAHRLRVMGLLPETTYDCLAAATCPTGEGPVAFTLETGRAPRELPEIVATVDPRYGMTGFYTLFNHKNGGGCGDSSRFLVVDPEGRPRFWHDIPNLNADIEVQLQPDGRFTWGGGYSPEGRLRRVDPWDGEIQALSVPGWESTTFHHDGKEVFDGRQVTLEYRTNTWLGSDFEGFGVRLFDPTGSRVLWDWSSQRAIDAGQLPVYSPYGDVFHANWVDVVDEGDRDAAYVSLCYYGWILKIDVPTGEVVWRFGPGGDFRLVDPFGEPLGDDQFTQCQHGLERVGNRLLAYDNGWSRGYTRVVEYELDEEAGVATRRWEWTDGWWEFTMGDADYLPNGRVLVGLAHPECWEDDGVEHSAAIEIDPVLGVEVARHRMSREFDALYRAERLDSCALFAHTRDCPALAERAAELGPVFGTCSAEVCNGVDDDCDGEVDEGFDADGDGVSTCQDCDDADPARSPLVEEVCNGVDDNCDGRQDEGFDLDGDGATVCAGDCDDADPRRRPGAAEACNGLDDDCSGVLDPAEADDDGDGWRVCAGDCDDGDRSRYPGRPEACNGLDDDCDPATDERTDHDGDGLSACAGDCDDLRPTSRPGAPELCDGLDQDCDGELSDADCGGCVWLEGSGQDYLACPEPQPWEEAARFCDERHFQLLALERPEEDDELAYPLLTLSWSSWWLGLSDRVEEGSFRYTDGSEPSYTDWSPYEPNDWGGGEDCTEWLPGYSGWNDLPCEVELPFVCEAR